MINFSALMDQLEFEEIPETMLKRLDRLEYDSDYDIIDYIQFEPESNTYHHLVSFYNQKINYSEYIEKYMLAYIAIISKGDNKKAILLLYLLYIYCLDMNDSLEHGDIMDYLVTYGSLTTSDVNKLILLFKHKSMCCQDMMILERLK